ncbi:MAG: hypothetical protein JSU70_07460 [Phycisphaerales bacterium]|nr:MAG: hypothetical protein JSU70_07460 [Phycisphaerales bacterium]
MLRAIPVLIAFWLSCAAQSAFAGWIVFSGHVDPQRGRIWVKLLDANAK